MKLTVGLNPHTYYLVALSKENFLKSRISPYRINFFAAYI